MESQTKTYWVVGAVLLALLVLAYWLTRPQPLVLEQVATSTTETLSTTTRAATSSATTTPFKPNVGSVGHMSDTDFKFFKEAGKCVKVSHTGATQVLRAIDFVETAVPASVEVWKCSDGQLYTQ